MNKKQLIEALMDQLDEGIFDRIEELRADLDAHNYFKHKDHILQFYDLVEELLDDAVDVWLGNLDQIYENIK